MSESCLFCRMSSGEVPVAKVYEDDLIYSIRDINPRAPVHVMIIPRRHIPSVAELGEDDGPMVTHMLLKASEIARDLGVAESGYRLTFNVGDEGGQTIYHLHLHLLGGRRLGTEG